MPTRMVREQWVTSPNFRHVSRAAEAAFVRLLVTVDDYGIGPGSPRAVLGRCWPTIDSVTEADVAGWLSEIEQAGLIQVIRDPSHGTWMKVSGADKYFRVRAAESKHPAALALFGQMSDKCPQSADNCQTNDGPDRVPRPGTETETKDRVPRAGDAASQLEISPSATPPKRPRYTKPPTDSGAGAIYAEWCSIQRAHGGTCHRMTPATARSLNALAVDHTVEAVVQALHYWRDHRDDPDGFCPQLDHPDDIARKFDKVARQMKRSGKQTKAPEPDPQYLAYMREMYGENYGL